MKYKIFLIITVLLLATVSVQAAAPIASTSIYTKDNGLLGQIVKIEDTDAGYKDKMITLKVWRSGKSEADLQPNTNDFAVLAMIKQTLADENGKYVFEFPFTQTAGDYSCEIKVEGLNGKIPYVFSISNIQPANDFLTIINDSTKNDEITVTAFNTLISYSEDLGIDTKIYDLLDKDDVVAEKMVSKLKENNQNNIKMKFEDLLELFDETVILTCLERSDDETLLGEMISHYEKILNLENVSGIYNAYINLKDKTTFFSNIGLTEYLTVEKFLETFKDKVFLQAFSEILYYTDMTEIIEINSEFLDLGDAYTEYNSSSSRKDYVQKYLITNKNSITSIEKFKSYFNEGLDLYDKESDTKPSGGSGGSPGGRDNISVQETIIAPENIVLPPPTPEFNDIKNHWAKEAITHLTKLDIVAGRSLTEFAPDDNITREEFTKLAIYAFYGDKKDSASSFADVELDRWSNPYISFAYDKKLILGKTNDLFYPEDNITRQDMAVILYRILEDKGSFIFRGEVNENFEDYDSVDRYAQNSVVMLKSMDLVKGSNNKFYPHNLSTRAEAVQMIYNILLKEELK